MNTKSPDLKKCLDAFRTHCCEPPSGYIWAAHHGLFGFAEFTQFEPWHFCGLEEIIPLSKRWKDFRADHEFVPFARRQDSDELACFKPKDGKTIGISVIHYGLGPPVSWEVCQEFSTFWDWVRGIIQDVEAWSEMQGSSPP